jgi:hypothetical protein
MAKELSDRNMGEFPAQTIPNPSEATTSKVSENIY